MLLMLADASSLLTTGRWLHPISGRQPARERSHMPLSDPRMPGSPRCSGCEGFAAWGHLAGADAPSVIGPGHQIVIGHAAHAAVPGDAESLDQTAAVSPSSWGWTTMLVTRWATGLLPPNCRLASRIAATPTKTAPRRDVVAHVGGEQLGEILVLEAPGIHQVPVQRDKLMDRQAVGHVEGHRATVPPPAMINQRDTRLCRSKPSCARLC